MAEAALALPSLRELMAKEPGALVEKVAKEHNTTPRAVVEALPDAMRTLAPGSAFIDVMKDIGSWGDLTGPRREPHPRSRQLWSASMSIS